MQCPAGLVLAINNDQFGQYHTISTAPTIHNTRCRGANPIPRRSRRARSTARSGWSAPGWNASSTNSTTGPTDARRAAPGWSARRRWPMPTAAAGSSTCGALAVQPARASSARPTTAPARPGSTPASHGSARHPRNWPNSQPADSRPNSTHCNGRRTLSKAAPTASAVHPSATTTAPPSAATAA